MVEPVNVGGSTNPETSVRDLATIRYNPLQFLYAHSLNTFLEGGDPVSSFGTRNLNELRSLVSLPIAVLVLDFMAKVFMVGGVTALLFIFGILNSP